MNSTKEKVRLAFHEDDETDPEENDGNENGSTPAAAKKEQSDSRVKRIIRNVVDDVTRYISIKFIMSVGTGVIVTIGLLIVHMKFPLVWGFLAFVLNFIPTFGSIISGLLTVTFALVQFYPSLGIIIYVAILMLATNMVIGSIVEPRVQGQNLGISPFIILVSLSLWGWMWGFMGMIIAVPIIVEIIVCISLFLITFQSTGALIASMLILTGRNILTFLQYSSYSRPNLARKNSSS